MRILIIEDEASIRDRLVRLTRSILGERIEALSTANTLSEAKDRIESEKFDLLLLDLNLNGKDGFDILRNLSSRSFHTIVVSAYTQRAIEAYDLGVLDFVSKPFDEERLEKAFRRIVEPNTKRSHFAKFLAVRTLGRIELVPLDEIEYIQADGPCSTIIKKDGSEKSHDKMLKDIAQLLPPSFERIHKSFLANMKAINGILNKGSHKSYVTFPSGRQAPLSRTKTKELKERL